MKKIAFCITCMNRLYHLQKTFEQNIKDNYLIDDIEFVLLDYNSNDGLDEWVYQNMKQYIDSGVLVYYKTFEPTHYLRSHSRNMAFRLANAHILCNLDADNFLGKGFAQFILREFELFDNIFYTSNYSVPDTFGRVCVRKKDFLSVRGYNESFVGYGFEDVDLFNQLKKSGLKQKYFSNPTFYNVIIHSDKERISEEYMMKHKKYIYIAYINPYTSDIIILYEDFIFERYILIDNAHLHVLDDESNSNKYEDERNRVLIKGEIHKGQWKVVNNKMIIMDNNNEIIFENSTFYEVKDEELITKIIFILTSAISFKNTQKPCIETSIVNSNGFGKGSVSKNFNWKNKIIL
jgi:hypothetical protein